MVGAEAQENDMRKAGGRKNLETLVGLAVLLVCATTAATLVRDVMPHERILPYTIDSTGRYVYDVAVGFPYMVSELPAPAGLTIAGGAVGGPLGALAWGFLGALYHTYNEMEWDKVGVYWELRDKGMPHDEAYKAANKDGIRAACVSILIGVLGSIPAQILRFVFKKRYSLTSSVLWALLISFLSLLVQTPLLYPPYGTGTTFVLSVATLLRPKQVASERAPRSDRKDTEAVFETPSNEDLLEEDEETDEQESFAKEAALKSGATSLDNVSLKESIILYIVSHSTLQRLSKSKLGGYLALISRQVDLGLEITLGEYGVQITGFQNLLNRLRDVGLLSIYRAPTVSGGYRYIYRANVKAQAASIPCELRSGIDKMIAEWDTKRSRALLKAIINNELSIDEASQKHS